MINDIIEGWMFSKTNYFWKWSSLVACSFQDMTVWIVDFPSFCSCTKATENSCRKDRSRASKKNVHLSGSCRVTLNQLGIWKVSSLPFLNKTLSQEVAKGQLSLPAYTSQLKALSSSYQNLLTSSFLICYLFLPSLPFFLPFFFLSFFLSINNY